MDDNFMNVKFGPVKPGYDYVMEVRGPFDHDLKRRPSSAPRNTMDIEKVSNK